MTVKDLNTQLRFAAEAGADFARKTADPGKVSKVTRDKLHSLIGAGSGADRASITVVRPYQIGETATVHVSLPVQVDGYWYDVVGRAEVTVTA